MGLLNRLMGRDQRPASQARSGSTQDWVDLVVAAMDAGLVRTTMPNLSEEQVTGTFASLVLNNGPVWALTLARAQLFSQARFQWTRFEGGERTKLFGSSELAVLERPWRGGTTADLLARMELDVSAAGNAYIRRLRRRSGDRLVRMRPDWVTIILGSQEDVEHPGEAADVEVAGYIYAPPSRSGQAPLLLYPEDVAHYAPYPDPTGVFVGMSWVTPVVRDVLGDNLQTDYKRAFFKNAASPNMAIKFDPSLTQDQVRQFREIFNEDHRGAENAYKTLFLGGGATPIPVGKDLREISFAETEGKAESRLASAAGVPPSWVGFSEGLQGSALNAGNFTAARRRLSDGTLQHLWANAATSLSAVVDSPANGEGAELWFATRDIPFLAMDAADRSKVQSEEASTITGLVRDGFTPESAIDAVTNHDWSRLIHTGLTSVQLVPPSNGQEPLPGEGGPNSPTEPGPSTAPSQTAPTGGA